MEQFLLFIIIAIASLVLNRKKNANKQQPDQRVEQGEPTVQQVPEIGRRDIGRPEYQESQAPASFDNARSLREAAEILFPQPKSVPEKKDEDVQRQMEMMKKQEELYRAQAQSVRNQAAAIKDQPERKAMAFKMQERDIVRGIIMSEVLGAPRALKPYGRK